MTAPHILRPSEDSQRDAAGRYDEYAAEHEALANSYQDAAQRFLLDGKEGLAEEALRQARRSFSAAVNARSSAEAFRNNINPTGEIPARAAE